MINATISKWIMHVSGVNSLFSELNLYLIKFVQIEIFCIHAAVMAQLETISYPERRNKRGNPIKGPENWRITVWQECTSNIINQQEKWN